MIKYWDTKIKAICPVTGELSTFNGPYVPGRTKLEAQLYCNQNYLGYCHVVDVNVVVDKHTPGEKPHAFWWRDIEYNKINQN